MPDVALAPLRTLAPRAAPPRTALHAAVFLLASAPSITAHAQRAPAAAPAVTAPDESPAVREAREHQTVGRRLLDAGNFNAALSEFERVYALLEGHPRRYTALANIGRCYQSLGRYDRAVASFRQYLAEAPAALPDRVPVEAALAALDDLLGTLVVTLRGAPRAELWVDDRQAGEATGGATPTELRVPGGRHVVEARAQGYLPVRREVSVAARRRGEVSFALERPGRGINRGVFFAAAGVTAATAVTGGVFGYLALAGRDALAQRIAANDTTVALRANTPAGRGSDEDPIATQAVVADALLVTAGVFAVASVVLAIVADWRGGERSYEGPPRSARRAAPVVLPSPGGLTVGGSF